MYTISVQRSFTAQHYLIGGDFGSENELHPHEYKAEVRLTGSVLDEHGFLVYIDDVNTQLDKTISAFRDQTLNDFAAFKNLNPSVEHFARIFCHTFLQDLSSNQLTSVTVRIWEYEDTWAEYTERLA